jgi:outer membrane protein TolC
MKRFSSLVTAVATVFGTLTSLPAAAQPRGRSQANAASAPAPAAASGDDDGDGPEAKAVATFKLNDIIGVAVRLSPDLARAVTSREAARQDQIAAGKDQALHLTAEANFEADAIGADTATDALPPLSPLSSQKISGSLGLARKLPTGGEVGIKLGINSSHTELNVLGQDLEMALQRQSQCGENADVICQVQVTAGVSFKQPLLKGMGSDVALADQHRADIAAAKATVEAQLAAEKMIYELVSTYWDLANASYEVDVRAASLELARKQDQLTRQEIRAGTIESNAIDAVSYEIAVREEALLTAKLQFEQKSLELRRKAGLEIGRRDIVVRPADPLELDAQDWSIDDVIAQSHRINRELGKIVLDKRSADIDVGVAHNQTLPQIDLSLQGTLLATGDTAADAFDGLGGNSNNNNSSLGGGGNPLASGGFGYQVVAGLTMSFELSGAAKAAHAAALAKRHLLDIQRVDKEREIDAQVVSAVKEVLADRTRVGLADKAIQVGEEAAKSERAKFLAKQSTNAQVMQAQTKLIEARLRRGQAVVAYRKAVAQLQVLSGTLLDTYRIHVRASSGASE